MSALVYLRPASAPKDVTLEEAQRAYDHALALYAEAAARPTIARICAASDAWRLWEAMAARTGR